MAGPDALGPEDGVHLLHSMGDTFAVMRTLEQAAPASAVIVGAGYIGLEMADALTVRGLAVTQMEQLSEVLPTVDPELGALVHAELAAHGVVVLTGTTGEAISKAPPGGSGRLHVQAKAADGSTVTQTADMVLVVVGVRPETTLAAEATELQAEEHHVRAPRTARHSAPPHHAPSHLGHSRRHRPACRQRVQQYGHHQPHHVGGGCGQHRP